MARDRQPRRGKDWVHQVWRSLRLVEHAILPLVVCTATIGSVLCGFYFSHHMEHWWVAWEVSSILFTIFFCVVMILDWFFLGNRLNDILLSSATGLAFLCSVAGLFALIISLVMAARTPEAIVAFFPEISLLIDKVVDRWLFTRATLVFAGAACFLTVNFLIFKFGKKTSNLTEPQVKIYARKKREAKEAILYSDTPTTLAFFVIAVFIFNLQDRNPNHDAIGAFFGGCVAFQLLASNIAFGSSQLREFRQKFLTHLKDNNASCAEHHKAVDAEINS